MSTKEFDFDFLKEFRYSHEADMARMERTIHRLWISNLVLFLVILCLGGFMFWQSTQYETVEETSQVITQELDADGGEAVIYGDVNINGKSETDGVSDEN